METRLLSISKALAQSAIDGYNSRATYMYLISADNAAKRVYTELLIGAKYKTTQFRLAKNIARVALIVYWESTSLIIDEFKLNKKMRDIENDSLFRRAVLATNATLKRMIKETNYQRRLHTNRQQINLLS